MKWEQVVARRLERHGLAAPTTDLAATVSAMCGAHAQVMSAAEASIGVRVTGVTRVDVREAVWTDRTVVKTRGPRGTVHLLAAADLPMWVGALGALPSPPYATGANALMTPDQVDQVVAAIAGALKDAELTTEELTAEVVARTGPWAGDRVMDAFQDKRIAVTVEAFCTLSPARRKQLGEQVERLGEILEATPTLTLGEVTVGGHA